MWRWLLILTLALPLSQAQASKPRPFPPTSHGPTSPEELAILRKKSREDFEARKYKEAIFSLERWIARYPGSEGYTEAHRLLGLAHLENGTPAHAVKPLRHYVAAVGSKTVAGVQTTLAIARAQLALKHAQEAQLAAGEVIDAFDSKKMADLPPELKTEALLIRSEAWTDLNQDERATLALAAAKKELPAQAPSGSIARLSLVELRLKSRACSKLATPRSKPAKLDEGQFRTELERKGNCLLEAALVARDVFSAGTDSASQRAVALFTDTFDQYLGSCNRPTPPPGKRTATELKAYLKELTAVVRPGCQTVKTQLLQFTQDWKTSLPAAATPYIELVSRHLSS